MPYELGFIGAGNMAEAIARAAIGKKIVAKKNIIAADPLEVRRKVFTDLGITTTPDSSEVIGKSKHVLLAIKPQALSQVALLLQSIDIDQQILVSIMAGISTERIEQAIGLPARIVRIMPNTPLIVGHGMAAVALGRHAQPGDDGLVIKLLAAAGVAIQVDEAALDAITAVSGSGPAYVFYLAEAMTQAAEALGLGSDADQLVRQTILGAAHLLAESGSSAAELRRQVTSPGGTTEAAIRILDSNGITEVVLNAIQAAHQRSLELRAS